MKKVFKGWVERTSEVRDVAGWGNDSWGSNFDTLGLYEVYRIKGKKTEWGGWPPKRVTITVEVDDD